MITNEKLKEQIELFPDKFSIDELVERLIFMEKVERGEKQSLNNDVIEHEQSWTRKSKNGSNKLDCPSDIGLKRYFGVHWKGLAILR